MNPSTPVYLGDPKFERAVELFNRGEFFDAHEEWEELWTPKSAADRPFLQALIHFAVACLHHERGNQVGFERQRAKGFRKIASYLPNYEGLDLERLAQQMEDVESDYPQIKRL